MNIYLKRQGISKTVKCSFDNYYIEVTQLDEKPPKNAGKWIKDNAGKVFIEIVKYKDKNTIEAANSFYADNMEAARDLIEKETGRKPEKEILAYMYYSGFTYSYLKNDYFLNPQTRYEKYSNTIRKIPENYCLIAFDNGDVHKPIFDIDGATMLYREIVETAYKEYIKSHNQRMGEIPAKEWLAWLISEYIISAGLETKKEYDHLFKVTHPEIRVPEDKR